jgi:ubiquinone/menaquinone biosynthesis C-methylase UbiE
MLRRSRLQHAFHAVWIVGLLLFLRGAVAASFVQEPSEAELERSMRVADIIKALDARPGSRIADVGAGDGFYTVRIARAVLPGGSAIGEDIRESATQKLRDRATKEQLSNVEVVVGALDDPKLTEGSFDAVLVHNAYHEFEKHEAMLEHILKALKPGGRFVLVEPFRYAGLTLPRDQQVAKHELAPDMGERELRAAGFTIVDRQNEFVKFTDTSTEIAGGFWMIIAKK